MEQSAGTQYIPLLVEVTRFFFLEVGKWIDRVRSRLPGKSAPQVKPEHNFPSPLPPLTEKEFNSLAADQDRLAAHINRHLASAEAYVLQSLVEQIETHRRSLSDFEKAEAEFGVLVPPHVKRGIEREAEAITEKCERLKHQLEAIYDRRIEDR
jgi:hypothetical protein